MKSILNGLRWKKKTWTPALLRFYRSVVRGDQCRFFPSRCGSFARSSMISSVTQMPRKAWLIRLPSGTDAGSRTDFWGKNRAIFSGELFSGEEFLPRTAFSGKKCRSILSNQVISWNGSRADRCCQNVFSSWGLSSFGLNQNFLFVEKKKTQMEVRDLWIHSTANYREQSCRQVMLLPKFLSRKKLSRKYRSIFASKISPATGVMV